MAVNEGMPDAATLAAIRSDIEAYERARISAGRSVNWRLPLGLGLVVLAVLLVARFLNRFADPLEQWLSAPHVFLYVLGLAAAIAAYVWAGAPARRAQDDGREKTLFPSIFRFIDDLRYTRGSAPASFDRFPREMVGAFDRESFDDVIAGRYRGFPFELFEVKLGGETPKGSGDAGDVFKGVGLVFEAAQSFPGFLVARARTAQKTGFLSAIFGSFSSLDEIKSGVSDLEASYEFRTDNLEAASPLIVGRLVRALKWLIETWPKGQPLVALKGGDAFVLLPMERNYFDLPGPSAPIDYDRDIKPMIAELVALLETAALVRRVTG